VSGLLSRRPPPWCWVTTPGGCDPTAVLGQGVNSGRDGGRARTVHARSRALVGFPVVLGGSTATDCSPFEKPSMASSRVDVGRSARIATSPARYESRTAMNRKALRASSRGGGRRPASDLACADLSAARDPVRRARTRLHRAAGCYSGERPEQAVDRLDRMFGASSGQFLSQTPEQRATRDSVSRAVLEPAIYRLKCADLCGTRESLCDF
jgi:hypothetical protein